MAGCIRMLFAFRGETILLVPHLLILYYAKENPESSGSSVLCKQVIQLQIVLLSQGFDNYDDQLMTRFSANLRVAGNIHGSRYPPKEIRQAPQAPEH